MNLILYGAGKHAVQAMNEVEIYRKKGYEPVCFCDKDTQKQGKDYLGLPVFSIEQALSKYDDYFIFVTLWPGNVKFEVFHELTEFFGITKERILNFEESLKYLSCEYLQYNMVVQPTKIEWCCLSPYVQATRPKVELFTDDVPQSISSFQKLKEQLIRDIQDSKQTPCTGCIKLTEGYWSVDNKIQHIGFGFEYPCQLSCCYCHNRNSVRKIAAEAIKNQQQFSWTKFFETLENNELISSATMVGLASGEITCTPNKDAILASVTKYSLGILTNAVLYDEQIALLAARIGSHMNVSVDSGIRETYKLVKGLDVFDRVFENIGKYIAKGVRVIVKYIFLPQNSDDENVIGFINNCIKAGVKEIQISRDYSNPDALPLHIIKQIGSMVAIAKSNQIEVVMLETLHATDIDRLKEDCSMLKEDLVTNSTIPPPS
ncbi:hypothetical protein FACS1894167_05310 [Synergistales bacterium]|nr:hypothetical protein FACS1894167_05310 [Synergistales bacterium]